jgi:octaprenyl-diphosphate synthase
MNLKEIAKPIARHLDEFNAVFRAAPATDVALLNTVVRYVIRQKGKQIRPILVLLSAEACGGAVRDSYVAATLVELLHTATLVHDDVVDESDRRRGVASVNAVWKNKVAVLVGDFLLARGMLIAMEHDRADFLKITTTAVRRMSEGELLQIQKSRTLNIDEATYFRIIGDKTASLVATCCELGAASTNAPPAVRVRMSRFGEHLGIAFQIRDDVFDYASRRAQIGKPVGIDLKEKKLTLPLIYSLSQAPKREGKDILALVKEGKGSKVRSAVGAFVERFGGIAYAMKRASDHALQAKLILSELPPSAARTSLQALTEFVVSRDT